MTNQIWAVAHRHVKILFHNQLWGFVNRHLAEVGDEAGLRGMNVKPGPSADLSRLNQVCGL